MSQLPKRALLVAVIALALAACGGTPSTQKATTASSTTTTTARPITSATVTINGTTYPVPRETPGTPIQSFSDTGQQVVLTSSGFLPRTLFSSLHIPVVFTNLTRKVVTLTIENVGLQPTQIQPGGHYSWTPNVLAFGYRSSTGDFGIVNVGAFQN